MKKVVVVVDDVDVVDFFIIFGEKKLLVFEMVKFYNFNVVEVL